jgi:hypothetical protein
MHVRGKSKMRSETDCNAKDAKAAKIVMRPAAATKLVVILSEAQRSEGSH